MKGPACPMTNEASRMRRTMAYTVPALPCDELSLIIFEPSQNARALAAKLSSSYLARDSYILYDLGTSNLRHEENTAQ